MRRATFTERHFYFWAAVATAAMEGATILARILSGHSAAEFNAAADPPLLLKMHHMFWAAPLILVALFVSGKRASYVLWAVALGLIASDLMHHFIVLPIWVGNTGWHWP